MCTLLDGIFVIGFNFTFLSIKIILNYSFQDFSVIAIDALSYLPKQHAIELNVMKILADVFQEVSRKALKVIPHLSKIQHHTTQRTAMETL